jgi:hypothetical protein
MYVGLKHDLGGLIAVRGLQREMLCRYHKNTRQSALVSRTGKDHSSTVLILAMCNHQRPYSVLRAWAVGTTNLGYISRSFHPDSK